MTHHQSQGFSIGPLLRATSTEIAVVRLDTGGCIGRHPADDRQLLLLVEGDAQVSGDPGDVTELAPGQAAVWEPGEHHEA